MWEEIWETFFWGCVVIGAVLAACALIVLILALFTSIPVLGYTLAALIIILGVGLVFRSLYSIL